MKNNENIEVSVKGRKFEIIETIFCVLIGILLLFCFKWCKVKKNSKDFLGGRLGNEII